MVPDVTAALLARFFERPAVVPGLFVGGLESDWRDRVLAAPVELVEGKYPLRVTRPAPGGDVVGLVAASVASGQFEASFEAPRLLTPGQHRRGKLAARVLERDRGLSNTAYLAATSGTQNLRLTISPARVKFTLSDPLADLPLSGPVAGGGRRGVVREFSDGARDRLADRAAELQAVGKIPEVMLTLTSPANWEEIYLYDPETGEALEGGRLFKQHLDTFRKRLDRFLQKLGVHHWGALWFLEFQERGAPHVHLILFDCKLSGEQRRTVRGWLGRAWSSVVGNPSKFEKGKHARAGTQVARMKKQHFGYAQKYASKMTQKCVPDGFHGVGRFWGVWNCKKSSPVVLELDYSRLNEQERDFVHHLALVVLGTVYPHSPDFFSTRIKRVWDALQHGIRYKQGFSIYGSAASEKALSWFA